MSGTDGRNLSAELRALTERALEALAANDGAAAARDAAPAVARDPKLLARLVADGDLQRSLTRGDFATRAPSQVASEAAAMAELRQWRRRELVRIAWRDLAGWAGLEETLGDTSAFADAA